MSSQWRTALSASLELSTNSADKGRSVAPGDGCYDAATAFIVTSANDDIASSVELTKRRILLPRIRLRSLYPLLESTLAKVALRL